MKEKVYDMYGSELEKGDHVIWVDPETKTRAAYEIYEEPTKEMVKLWSKYGECEALPTECYLFKTKRAK